MKHFYVGVDVGGTNIKSALVKNGKVLQRAKLPTNGQQGPVPVINQIKKAIRTFGKPIAGIGIGIAGIIDSKKGIVRYSPNLIDWNNIKLARAIRDEFSIPVHILNDVNAVYLGEWKFGAAKGHNSVFLFTLGTGVGGGIISGGRLLEGCNHTAGELGHMTIVAGGRHCRGHHAASGRSTVSGAPRHGEGDPRHSQPSGRNRRPRGRREGHDPSYLRIRR